MKGARLRFDKVRETHVLMVPETVVMLGDSAAEILTLCDGSRSIDDIIGELSARYPDADLAQDVKDFLKEAAHERWIS